MPQITPEVTNVSLNGYVLTLSYNTDIIAGSGNLYIYKSSNNSLQLTIPITSATISGPTLTLPTFQNILTNGETYYVTADYGYIQSFIAIDCFYSSVNAPALTARTFTLPNAFQLIDFVVDSTPFAGNLNKVNPQTNIGLIFNKTISFTTSGAFTIYNSSGAIHQTINVTTNFNDNKTNELIWIGDDPNSTGTQYTTVYINPTKDLTLGQTYYVLATPTCVKSYQDEFWSGLSNVNTVRFTVDPGPTATLTPISSTSTNIELVYDRTVEPGSGVLQIKDQNGNVLYTLQPDDPAITYIEE